MSVDEESIKETYKKLSDLTEQLTSLTTMSKVVANTALLHDIHNQLAALNHLSEDYKNLLSKQLSNSGSFEDDVKRKSIEMQTNAECIKAEDILRRVEQQTNEVKKSFNLLNNAFGLNKMARFLLFVFMFFFIFKIIDHILDFFDVNKDIGYIYFVWFTIMFFLFVVLPLQRSRLQPTPKQQES